MIPGISCGAYAPREVRCFLRRNSMQVKHFTPSTFKHPVAELMSKYGSIVTFHQRVRDRAFPGGTSDQFKVAVPASAL